MRQSRLLGLSDAASGFGISLRVLAAPPVLAAAIALSAPLYGAPATGQGMPQSRVHRFSIAPSDLQSALLQFASQADVQIVANAEDTRGRSTNGLSGEFRLEEALARLLAGSGLHYKLDSSGTITVVRASASQAQPSAAPDLPETPAPPPAQASVQEVVVTAQKRLEPLQDVPVAVTALSGDALDHTNVRDSPGLVNMAPSLTYTQGANVVNTNFRVRGIGTAVFGPGLEPSVSVVMDGVVLARAGQGFTDLADIQRVEVLRGPQGTLFGKNAIGGLINVITERPARVFEAKVGLAAAEKQEYRVRGSISGPLSDSLAARLTAYYSDVGGVTRNLVLNDDVNGYVSKGVRGKLAWQANDAADLLLTADYHEADARCCSSVYLQVENPLLRQLLLPTVASFNNRQEVENVVTYNDSQQTLLALEGNFDLGGPTLTSITAYQHFLFENNQPTDRLDTPVPLYLPVTNGQLDINGANWGIKQFTQELRVSSPTGPRFNYLVGLYFLDMDLDFRFVRRTGACASDGDPPAFGQFCVIPLYRSQGGMHSSTKTQNIAAFGQADVKVLGGLTALAGIRVQYEKVSYRGSRPDQRLVAGDLPLVGLGPSAGSGSTTDTPVTGKLGLKYELSQHAQTYLTWSTGYKGAGYHTGFDGTFENQQPVRPEKARAWELGFKTQLLHDRLTVNSAVFYSDYTDLQVQANRGNPDLGIVSFAPTNAGSANTKGVEVEFSAWPMRSLFVTGGVTYLLTDVDINGLNCPLSSQAAAAVIADGAPHNACFKPSAAAAPIQNIRGGDLPSAPRWRGTLSVRYDIGIPRTSLAGFMQLSGMSQSKSNFTIEQDPLTVQDAYTTVDASLGLRDQNDRYRLTLFVRNLFDEHYLTSIARAATLTTATVTPNSLTGTVPKEANRYFGATIGMAF